MIQNRRFKGLIAIILIVAAGAGGIGYRTMAANVGTEKNSYRETTVEYGDLKLTFEEEGTTRVSVTEQILDFAVGNLAVEVGEVYIETGAEVQEGDPLLKITAESMEDAITYYEEAVADAKEELNAAQLAYQEGLLTQESELLETRTDAENADENYEASMSNLQVKVEEKLRAYQEAVESIQTYQSNLDQGVYYTKAGINEKQTAVDEAKALAETAQSSLAEAKNAYETVSTLLSEHIASLNAQISAGAAGEELLTAAGALASDYESMQTAASDLTAAQTAAGQAQSALEKNQQVFDAAVKSYNTDVEEATKKITELTDSLDELNEAYEQAKRDAVTEEADIQKEYEEALLFGEYADTTYETTIDKLKRSVTLAQEKVDELSENQRALLSLEDRVICASQSGTIAYAACEAGQTLKDETALVRYYDTSEIMISVEVSQEMIASVAVGNSVDIAVTGERDTVPGTISSIAASATTSGSVSNITYTVVVTADNQEGRLSLGVSAAVTFCYGTLSEVLYIEKDAVTESAQGTDMVLRDSGSGEAEEIPVTVGESTDDRIVITDGLSEGDICLIRQEEQHK